MLSTVAFHGTNSLIWQLGEFPFVMLATNLLFLDALPSRLARIFISRDTPYSDKAL